MKLKKAKWKEEKTSDTQPPPQETLAWAAVLCKSFWIWQGPSHIRRMHQGWDALTKRADSGVHEAEAYVWHRTSWGCFPREGNPQLELHVHTGELYVLKDICKLERGHKTDRKTQLLRQVWRTGLWSRKQKTGEGHGNMFQCMFQYSKHCYKNNDNQSLTTSTEGRMSRNEPNMQQRIFRIDIRKPF